MGIDPGGYGSGSVDSGSFFSDSGVQEFWDANTQGSNNYPMSSTETGLGGGYNSSGYNTPGGAFNADGTYAWGIAGGVPSSSTSSGKTTSMSSGGYGTGSRGTSSGGGSGSSDTSMMPRYQIQTSTSTRTPTKPMPVLAEVAPYTNPTWDTDKIKSLAQEDSALGISEARDALYQGINKVVAMQGNPTAQSAAMRDLLKGHGSAIAKVMQGANKEALGRYQIQYQYQVQEAITRFDALQKAAYAKYAADLQDYLASMKTTTTGNMTSGIGTGTGNNNLSSTPTTYGQWDNSSLSGFGNQVVGYNPNNQTSIYSA